MKVPKIHRKDETTFIGVSAELSLENFAIAPLWRSFMQLNAHYQLPDESDFYAITDYPQGYFNAYNPKIPFTKTVGIAYENDGNIPDEMVKLVLPATTYAIIEEINGPLELPRIIQSFLSDWIPNSSYRLLDQPHIEVIDRSHYLLTNEMLEAYWFPVELK